MVDPSGLMRQARQRAGLTQEQLAERSMLSIRTIRALERGSGASPRLASLIRVATALGMTVDDRRDLIAAWGFDASRAPLPIDAMRDASGHHEQLMRLFADAYDATHLMTSIRSVTFDDRGHVARERVERVQEADRNDVDSVFLIVGDIGCSPDRIRVVDAEGFAVRRSVGMPHADAVAFELGLPHPMKRGERHAYGMTIEYDRPAVSDQPVPTSLGVWFPRPAWLCVIRARFAASRVPTQLRQVFREGLDGPFTVVRELTSTVDESVQLVIVEPSPGWHGISWASSKPG